jgi:hypothetical protein
MLNDSVMRRRVLVTALLAVSGALVGSAATVPLSFSTTIMGNATIPSALDVSL